jgi:hypothetical protein
VCKVKGARALQLEAGEVVLLALLALLALALMLA